MISLDTIQNRIIELKKQIHWNSYVAGIFITHLLKEKTRTIELCSGKFIEYDTESNIFFEQSKTITTNIKQNNAKNNAIILMAKTFSEVVFHLLQYQFICYDSEFESLVMKSGYNYVKEQKFENNVEGITWKKIIQLFDPPCSSKLLDELELLSKTKINQNNVFPYIQYSYLNDHSFVLKLEKLIKNQELQKIFEFITNKKPTIYTNNDLIELKYFLDKGLCFEKQFNLNCNKYLIDKSLAQYFDNVLYIGIDDHQPTSAQLLYQPKFIQHKPWENQKISLTINSTYEEKLYNNGEFAKLAANNISAQINKKNIYKEIKNHAIAEIHQRVQNKLIDNQWKKFLRNSGIEYIKICKKAENLIDNFFTWYNQKKFDQFNLDTSIQDFKINFIGHEKKLLHIAILYWQHPTLNNLLTSDPKIKKIIKYYNDKNKKLQSLAIISCEKITQLDLTKLEKYSSPSKKNNIGEETDLFYWNKKTNFNLD